MNVDDVLKENQEELNSLSNPDQNNSVTQLDSGENPSFDEIKKSLSLALKAELKKINPEIKDDLQSINRKAKSLYNKQGIETLYVARYFLYVNFEDNKSVRAPLLFLQVEINNDERKIISTDK
ncbi:DUF4011 domain-containing protein [bacterium]|nr:DUF4011 domain-containing protein [bacterium]